MARPQKFDDADILDRATDLFWRQGGDGASIRELEAALELKAPAIYRRFHSKEDLLARCIDRYVERTVAGRVRVFLDGAADPLEGLHAFFTSTLEPHPGEARLRGCLLTSTAAQTAASSPVVKAALERGFETIETAFRRQLKRAQAAGRLAKNLDIDATAKALLIWLQGLLAIAPNSADGLPAAIDAALNGLAPPQ